MEKILDLFKFKKKEILKNSEKKIKQISKQSLEYRCCNLALRIH